ncbi:MAG: T9SS type A sorting domain-containing protein [Ignavibacteriae bacterium]|nr:T9SS type A sorting domain-containing protein [Ignavibacteria bacterium]MBI3365853.1 T9SS type A sorting domain-containing protein [Ignavibacteriota bacterium]
MKQNLVIKLRHVIPARLDKLTILWRAATLFGIITFLAISQLSAQVSHWVKQQSTTSKWLNGADFINGNVGWAVGFDGIIVKTIDGGDHWLQQPLDSSISLLAVDFINPDTGWATGYDTSGIILRTTDGGAHWDTHHVSSSLSDVQFSSPAYGWSVGPDGVLHSTDGGHTWEQQVVDTSGAFFTSVFFLNDSIGWITGQVPGLVLRTIDAGLTWQRQTSGIIDSSETINDVFFINADTGWIAGFGYNESQSYGLLRKSTDGGTTWVDPPSGTDQYLLSIGFSNANRGWAVGGSGTIVTTTDGGQTWTKDLSNTTSELNKIVVQNSGAWVAGSDGLILKRPFGSAYLQANVRVQDGWNLIGLPLLPDEVRKDSIFRTATSHAFTYYQTYEQRDTIEFGRGYWLKFLGDQTINLTGLSVDSLRMSLPQGWNMVCGITDPLPVDSIIEDPPNSVTAVFGYDGAYYPATVLDPGKGYWIKTNQNCTVTFLSSPLRGNVTSHTWINLARLRSDELPPVAPIGNTIKEEEKAHVPAVYALRQNYPNPFNPSTTISFDLPEESRVDLGIYNMLGQEVFAVVSGMLNAGSYTYRWNATGDQPGQYSSGAYFYWMTATSRLSGKIYSEVKKMILTK